MKQRIIYILKHNGFVQKIYKLCFSFIFKFFGKFIKTDENMVLFVSFMGMKFNDSPKAIYDYIQERDKYKTLKCVWAFDNPENFPNLNTVKIDTLSYFLTALKAKYWVTNTNIERGLTFKKKGTVYLNTEHGTAIKYVGNDCPGRKDFNFKTVDYLCIASEYDRKVFKSAFNVPEESFFPCGRPCDDVLWNISEEVRNEIRKKLGIPDNKKVILYAPTWRDSVNGGKTYDIKPPIDLKYWEEQLKDEYILLFRAHHITTKVLNVSYNDFVRDASGYPDINELMIAADILVSDYSSVFFDYSILEKPMFCFAYDYKEYAKERGMYIDMTKEFSNELCFTENELLERIKFMDEEIEKNNTKEFKSKFVQYGGNGIKQCVEKLFG